MRHRPAERALSFCAFDVNVDPLVVTGYKKPKHVRFVDEMPKTNVGKILRRELRDAAVKEMEV